MNQESLYFTRLAGDKTVELLTLQNSSMHAAAEGRPREAFQIARSVLEGDYKLSPRIKALFLTRKARALAQSGDESALRLLPEIRDLYLSRGRDRPYGRPPAQIPACGITALGSYLGCVAAKRASGKGCITRTGGSHRFRIRTIRVQSTLVFWLRRRSAFSQYRVTWSQKAATAS